MFKKLLFAAIAAVMMTGTAQAIGLDDSSFAKVVVLDSGKTLRFVCAETVSGTKGVLKGRITVYAVSPAGKLVKNKFTVAGVLIDGVGYAAGTSKKLPAIPFVLAK